MTRLAFVFVALLSVLSQRTSADATAADVKTTVVDEGAGVRRYTYVIVNTSSSLDIAAVEIQGSFTAGASRVPNWAPSLVGTTKLAWRAMLPSAWLTSGQSLSPIQIVSRALPGVGHVRVFPATMPAWDVPRIEGTPYQAVCPVIGSTHLQPLRAAADIVTQLRDNLVAAIRADADSSANEIDRLLEETLAAVRSADIIRVSETLQAVAAVGWQRSSRWRQTLHESLSVGLAYVLALVNRSTELESFEVTGVGLSVDWDERSWEYPGVAVPPTDLESLIRYHPVAFIGNVEQAVFEDNGLVGARTRVRLRPTEVLRSEVPLSSTASVDVWLRGGIYERSRRTGNRWPVQRADAAAGLEVGDSVFVAAAIFKKPGSPLDGQLWIDVPDTFVRFKEGRVRPGPTYSAAWIDTALARSRSTVPAGAQSEVELFLSVLRAEVRRIGDR